MAFELVCATCGNNRFDYPDRDSGPVLCQFCGDSIGTLGEVKAKIEEDVVKTRGPGNRQGPNG